MRQRRRRGESSWRRRCIGIGIRRRHTRGLIRRMSRRMRNRRSCRRKLIIMDNERKNLDGNTGRREVVKGSTGREGR